MSSSSSLQPIIGGRSAGRAAQWLTGALATLATV
jgi:hypothetical protein